MRVRVVPYDKFSEGAKLLAQALSKVLGYKVYRGPAKANRINLKWGDPDGPCANKLDSFGLLAGAGVPIPDFTTSAEKANSWLKDGQSVVVRKLLKASEGRGIVMVEPGNSVPNAPLYVKYLKKKKEFRVHVWQDQVVLVQEKRKRKGVDADPRIRNHGDWVFCTKNILEPEDLRASALAAVKAVCKETLSGAVDVIWNKKLNKCFVLEINSAPGLASNSSAMAYAEHIKSRIA